MNEVVIVREEGQPDNLAFFKDNEHTEYIEPEDLDQAIVEDKDGNVLVTMTQSTYIKRINRDDLLIW